MARRGARRTNRSRLVLLGALVTVGLLAAGCSSGTNTQALPETTTEPTMPPRPTTTVPPVATPQILATITPERVGRSNIVRLTSAVTGCTGLAESCPTGEPGQVFVTVHCEDGGCQAADWPNLEGDPIPSGLTNDGTGMWSATYALLNNQFSCGDRREPTTRTIRFRVTDATWLRYEGQFEASQVEGTMSDHTDGAHGCEPTTIDYELSGRLT